jgi:hypothetical protein
MAVNERTNARSPLKDDATFSGILRFSGLRPVAVLYLHVNFLILQTFKGG